jgi:hypothetical protein
MARPADEGIRDREVERHAERIGDQEQQENERRAHEDRAQPLLAVEELSDAGSQRGAAGCGGDIDGTDGHGQITRR